MTPPSHRLGAGLQAALAWLLIDALLAGCAHRHVAPIGANGEPFRPDSDERALWAQAEKEEETLLKKTRTFDDPLLDEYLAKVGEGLLPDSVREAGGPSTTFAVVRDPTLNAFAMPNGRVYVHTGLLAKLDNEAQLATILGREMTHITNRHALSAQRGRHNTPITDTVAGVEASIGAAAAADARTQSADPVGAAMLSQTASAVLGLGLPLAARASINGYGRDLEREADAGGVETMVQAGYDPKEAPKVFERLKQESKEGGSLESFFLGNPLRLDERIATTRQLLATTYATAAASPNRVKDSEAFQLRMRSVVRDNAYEDIRAGRFKLAQRQLDRVLAVTPTDPIVHLYAGDLHRLQAQRTPTPADKDAEAKLALAAYERSVALDGTMPEPYRQLGLLYYQQKDSGKAKAAFEKYLALSPKAPDAQRIKGYIVELDR